MGGAKSALSACRRHDTPVTRYSMAAIVRSCFTFSSLEKPVRLILESLIGTDEAPRKPRSMRYARQRHALLLDVQQTMEGSREERVKDRISGIRRPLCPSATSCTILRYHRYRDTHARAELPKSHRLPSPSLLPFGRPGRADHRTVDC